MVGRFVHSQHRRSLCQNELVIHAGKINLCRGAKAVRIVISRARTVRTAMNTASFAGIRSDSSEHRCNPAQIHRD